MTDKQFITSTAQNGIGFLMEAEQEQSRRLSPFDQAQLDRRSIVQFDSIEDVVKKTFVKRLCNHEPIDRIVIEAQPWYKTSGSAGGEWRAKTVAVFYSKGKKVYEHAASNVRDAIFELGGAYNDARDTMEEALDPRLDPPLDTACQNVGCKNKATVAYRLKRDFCVKCANDKFPMLFFTRIFCDEHSTRGDLSWEDADANYVRIFGNDKSPVSDDMVCQSDTIVVGQYTPEE